MLGTPAGAVVPDTPPITPATNVPWNDCDSSSGWRDSEVDCFEGKNARATITFGVSNPGTPFGNPAGYDIPAPLRNGWFGSIAVVDHAPPSRRRRRRPLLRAARVRRSRSDRRSSTSCSSGSGRRGRTRGGAGSGSLAAGRSTENPSRRSRYRWPTLAEGIARRSVEIARAWAAAIRARYAFEERLARSSLRRAVAPKTALSARAAASGGSDRETITVAFPAAARLGTVVSRLPRDQIARGDGPRRERLVRGRGGAYDGEPEDDAEEQRAAHEVRTVADRRRRLRATCAVGAT